MPLKPANHIGNSVHFSDLQDHVFDSDTSVFCQQKQPGVLGNSIIESNDHLSVSDTGSEEDEKESLEEQEEEEVSSVCEEEAEGKGCLLYTSPSPRD